MQAASGKLSHGERRPSVFIGSSSEGGHIAEAIQANLARECEVTTWSQGVFGLSDATLDALLESADKVDFAVLVLTPDDMTKSRGKRRQSPRDNVIFEIGLFLGRLGRKRTFVVFDRTANLKLPSDLAGITLASYQPHADGNMRAALGEACVAIKSVIFSSLYRWRRQLIDLSGIWEYRRIATDGVFEHGSDEHGGIVKIRQTTLSLAELRLSGERLWVMSTDHLGNQVKIKLKTPILWNSQGCFIEENRIQYLYHTDLADQVGKGVAFGEVYVDDAGVMQIRGQFYDLPPSRRTWGYFTLNHKSK